MGKSQPHLVVNRALVLTQESLLLDLLEYLLPLFSLPFLKCLALILVGKLFGVKVLAIKYLLHNWIGREEK